MMRSVSVPFELLAITSMQRPSARETGTPHYLPALESGPSPTGRGHDLAAADLGATADNAPPDAEADELD